MQAEAHASHNRAVLGCRSADTAAPYQRNLRAEPGSAEILLLVEFVDRSMMIFLWCCCCSVNEAVINNPANPLLVVNNRLQLVMAERRKQRTAQGSKADSRVMSAHRGTAAAGTPQPVLHLQGAGLVSVPAVSGSR